MVWRYAWNACNNNIINLMETTVHHALKPTSNVNNRYFLRHLATIMMSQLTVNLSCFFLSCLLCVIITSLAGLSGSEINLWRHNCFYIKAIHFNNKTFNFLLFFVLHLQGIQNIRVVYWVMYPWVSNLVIYMHRN